MPTGPKGEKRPADVIGNAVKAIRIATGEETDELPDDGKDPAAKAIGMLPCRFDLLERSRTAPTAHAI